MKTPNLIYVPKSQPTLREKLRAIRIAHQIQTYRSNVSPPWVALHMPSAHRIGASHGVTTHSSIGECFAQICRLIEEHEIAGYGDTEKEAIQDLCNNLKIDMSR